jgi:hypothetical protein
VLVGWKYLRIAGLLSSWREDHSDWCLGAFCPDYRVGPDCDPLTRVTLKVPEVIARMVLAMAATR